MKKIIEHQKPEIYIDSFPVVPVDDIYYKMNDSFNDERYDETVSYARSMIESTFKYVYGIIKGNSVSEDLKRQPKLHELSVMTLKIFNNELANSENVIKMTKQVIDIIDAIGNMRNDTDSAHGPERRTIPVNKIEARFVKFNAESIVQMMLDLLFTKTHSLKRNAVNGIIDTNGLKKYNASSYKDEERDISYLVLPDSGIIHQVELTLPSHTNLELDSEFFSEHIADFVEDDVTSEDVSENGIHKYRYYSKKKDFYYDVLIQNNVIYISREF
ncbi:hypothetical protein IV73_GL000157 [Weissella kandleri]|uniref:Abortive infection protein-like C-terminal domain-containing protein n=1 Tax=Weissella kandleri TaxID=1616 RepID=A0A0R2JE60_9LACO|nr:abortive infection family protein [Weissella kandleri]KRN75664.1 hypothetical protein IV73_GL000157 [Weissella kandleri]